MSYCNYIEMCGKVLSTPVFSNSYNGNIVFSFAVEVGRLSGAKDIIFCTAPKSMLDGVSVGKYVLCKGHMYRYRSPKHNNGHAMFRVDVDDIEVYDSDIGIDTTTNKVEISGFLRTKYDLRVTPLGRVVMDTFIGVSGENDNVNYFPCVFWEESAEEVSNHVEIGTPITVCGRLQSREYDKKIADGQFKRVTINEISVFEYTVHDKEALYEDN